MKRIFILTLSLIYIGSFLASAQMFPRVSKPASADVSMLALQFAHDNNGELTNVINANWSAWIPAVTASDGSLVKFRHFGAGADFKVWKNVYVGIDARYNLTFQTVDGVDINGMTTGAYAGFGF